MKLEEEGVLNLVNRYFDLLGEALTRARTHHFLYDEVSTLIFEGRSICTIGVGKSGYIAHKFAASLRSIGFTADFIHAGEALHGDLGRLHKDDVVVIFSKSGNSEEIKVILPLLKARDVKVVALTNCLSSPLGKGADYVLDIATVEEGDVLNALPLISSTMSLIIADVLTVLISRKKGLTLEEFRKNHPGGQLGFAAGVVLGDLSDWKTRQPIVKCETSIIDTMLTISDYRAGLACVVDEEGSLSGIVTDGDIRKCIANNQDLSKATAGEWMNSRPTTAKNDMLVEDVLRIMERGVEKNIFAVPVLDEKGICLGVASLHDLLV